MREPRSRAGRRRATAERARGRCEYCLCLAAYSSDPFSVEHIRPRVTGGTDHSSNLAFSCLGCNNFKYTATEATDPTTGETVPLYNPRKHQWRDHFAWSEDLLEMTGLTPVGRATISKLQLNRPGVLNLRRVLRREGEHPPRETVEES
jgi:HNH endonuclease